MFFPLDFMPSTMFCSFKTSSQLQGPNISWHVCMWWHALRLLQELYSPSCESNKRLSVFFHLTGIINPQWIIRMARHDSSLFCSENRWVHYLWKRQTAVNQDQFCFLEKKKMFILNRNSKNRSATQQSQIQISGSCWSAASHAKSWRGSGGLTAATFGEAWELRLLTRSCMHRAEMLSGAREDVWGAGVGAFSVLM